MKFEKWLEEPVTAYDRRGDELAEQRLKILLRGEIPA